MTASAAPTADNITLSETITLLETDFDAVLKAVADQKFSLWIGSGISLDRAPSLGKLLALVIEHLRSKSTSRDDKDKYYVALVKVLAKADLDPAAVTALPLDKPFPAWPGATRGAIIDKLWGKYSSVLDVRVKDEEDDYLLWDAVDVRKEFGHLNDPDCEHLAIALLVLEGAVNQLASANWDGLIEVSIEQLAPNGRNGIVQVVVDPANIRDPKASSRLLKFHGCAVLCVANEALYRKYLIATKPQISHWPHNNNLRALRTEVLSVATTTNAIFVGLSLQDDNIRDIFSEVRQGLPLTWPCTPNAQHCVFCEDKIGETQDDMLRVAYGAHYGLNEEAIRKASLLRAFAKPALLALAIKVVTGKLTALLVRDLKPKFSAADIGQLEAGLLSLQKVVAAGAPPNKSDYATFTRKVIANWSRAASIYRFGTVPAAGNLGYQALSPLPLTQMMNDANVTAANVGKAALGLALLGRRHQTAGMTFAISTDPNGADGAFQAIGDWGDKKPEPAKVILVQNATSYLTLLAQGAFDGDNVVVLHSDDALEKLGAMSSARSPFGGNGTGRNRLRQVSITKLLDEATSLNDLEQRFAEKVTI